MSPLFKIISWLYLDGAFRVAYFNALQISNVNSSTSSPKSSYFQYFAFHKLARAFWSTKANWRLRFSLSLPSIILNWPLRKQNFTSTGSKGHGLWFIFGGFRSVLCVSVFQGSLFVMKTMTDGIEKRSCEAGF